MKKLLLILSFLITANILFAQINTGQKYVIKVNGSGGSVNLSNYFTKGQIDSINAGYYTKSQVDSIFTLSSTHLSEGTNVTISGSGTSGDPYVISSTGGGSPNSNIGSGFRLAVALTNNIKTVYSVSPLLLDSVTNSNALTFTFDTTVIHTTNWNNGTYGSLSQQNTNTSDIASNTSAIAGKFNTSDTTGKWLSPGTAGITYAPINNPVFTGIIKLSPSDTIATNAYARSVGGGGGGSGTVTSVAKGYGILADGTITTTGTVTVDTATLSNIYPRRKDSSIIWVSPTVAATTYATIANLALKLNISDTTSKWLSPGTAGITYGKLGGTQTWAGANTFSTQVVANSIKFSTASALYASNGYTVFTISPSDFAIGNPSYNSNINLCSSGSGQAGFELASTIVFYATASQTVSLNPLLISPITTTQQNALSSPVTGWQIFNTTLNKPSYYDGTSWRQPRWTTDSVGTNLINVAALNNGTTATTQALGDSTLKLMTTQQFRQDSIYASHIKGIIDTSQMAVVPIYTTLGIKNNTTLNPGYSTLVALPNVTIVTSISTTAIDADTCDLYIITAQAASLTIANPTGTPGEGQKLTLRIKDNGTSQTISSWGSEFRFKTGDTAPTSTTISKTMYVNEVYNSEDSKWDEQSINYE